MLPFEMILILIYIFKKNDNTTPFFILEQNTQNQFFNFFSTLFSRLLSFFAQNWDYKIKSCNRKHLLKSNFDFIKTNDDKEITIVKNKNHN